jgi:type I restriction enzyme M protein
LKQYELAHKWKHNKQTDDWEKNKPALKEAPQILFIERCLQLLKDGGRMAIVLPDGIYGNDQLGYIRKFILKQCRLVAVIDVPIETFMPNTGTKTSILIIQKLKNIPKDYSVFMCVSETCGHDRRGNEIEDDDISQVSNAFHKWMKDKNFKW